MLSKLIACLALVCLIAIVGDSQNKIVIIGSSTTYGYGLQNTTQESWVNRLKNYYLDQQVLFLIEQHSELSSRWNKLY